jgi:hypothetical protein
VRDREEEKKRQQREIGESERREKKEKEEKPKSNSIRHFKLIFLLNLAVFSLQQTC